MTFNFSAMLLALFGLSLILITLSLRLLRGTTPAGESYSSSARFFLIALRLAIGWHCFIEGMEKLNTPSWSSEVYLRESMGPFSPAFHQIAGDRLIAKLTVNDKAFPDELDREWRNYLNAFAAFYDLDAQQLERAQGILDQRKSDTLTYLTSKSETVSKISAYPPDLKVEMNMKQRLEEHERLLNRVRAAEAKFPSTDKDVHTEWKTAKADLAKWRTELKKSLDAQSAKLKLVPEATKKLVNENIEKLKARLNDLKDPAIATKLKKELAEEEAKLQPKGVDLLAVVRIDKLKERLKDFTDPNAATKLAKDLDAEKAKLWEPLGDVLTSEQKLRGPMPEPKRLPVSEWRLLEWSDALVKWGLVVLGAALMLGVCSRCSSFATALLILSFYAAMPPMPGWPESPRLEGHYLLINKTLIEVIALLALACIPTGCWAGVDGVLQLFCPCGAKRTPAAVTPGEQTPANS